MIRVCPLGVIEFWGVGESKKWAKHTAEDHAEDLLKTECSCGFYNLGSHVYWKSTII